MEGLEEVATTLDDMDVVYYGIQSLSIRPYGNTIVWNAVSFHVGNYAHNIVSQTKELWKD